MPVERLHRITRDYLRSLPGALFLFGDNDRRTGFGGQAREMRGEPNAVGIRTKVAPSLRSYHFWNDRDYEENCAKIAADLRPAFEAIAAGRIVVIPADGIGTGLSRLDRYAPKTFAYLQAQLHLLETGGSHPFFTGSPEAGASDPA